MYTLVRLFACYQNVDLFSVLLLLLFSTLHCLVGRLAMIVWTHVLFWVSYIHTFYMFVLVRVQRS